MAKSSPIHPLLVTTYQNLVLGIPALHHLSVGNGKVLGFLRAWEYLEGSGVRGDYLEFGVYQGVSFQMSMHVARKVLPTGMRERPRFFAFDSFQGLPDTDPTRDPGVFERGDYATTRELFERYTRREARHWETVVVEGLFADTLTPQLYERHQLHRAAFVNIDCDLYPSTRDALAFVTPLLQNGTVIYFDDWFTSSGDMRLGEAGACNDWLAQHPDIQLVDYGHVGCMGRMFLANC